MSANYNTALLRHLQAPLLAALSRIDDALSRVVEGQVRPQDMGVSKEAHEVSSGLNIIGRQAIARLAEAVERGVVALSEPERRGWDHIRTQTVARALSALVKTLQIHLQDMANGTEDLHVRLWPLWVALAAAMEETPPQIESLFEIDPDFDDETFTPRPAAYLAEVGTGAYERLVAAIGLVEVARTRADMEIALGRALEVFTHLYGLRHNRAYHTYWLILRARISAGLLKPEELIDRREVWLALLRDAGLQVRKFAADHRRLTAEKLSAALLPMLQPWPADWSIAHPVLAELDRRLGLSVFWAAVQEIHKDSADGAAAKFSLRQKDLEATVQQMRASWSKSVSVPVDQRKAALVAFLRALGNLMGKREWFPGTLADPLLESFRHVGDHLAERIRAKDVEAIPDFVAFEVAAGVLLLEELVERRARWTQDLDQRLRTQATRLELAIQNRSAELGHHAGIRWDSKWRERQVDKAVRLAVTQVLAQSVVVEKALSDLVRGEDVDEVRERFDELKSRCRVMGLALMTLRQPLASRLAEGLKARIEAISSAKALSAEAVADLAPAVASLMRFLQARQNGDVDAGALLRSGLEALFGVEEYKALVASAAAYPLLSTGPSEEKALEKKNEEDSRLAELETHPTHSTGANEAASKKTEGAVPVGAPRDLRSELLGEGVTERPRDTEILEIFLEEATAALEDIAVQRQVLLGKPHDPDAWAELRRQFHTLKGSGRISGLPALGEVAWWAEERINEALTLGEGFAPRLDAALGLAASRLADWFGELQNTGEARVQATEVRAALDEAEPQLLGLHEGAAPESSPSASKNSKDVSESWAPAADSGPEESLAPWETPDAAFSNEAVSSTRPSLSPLPGMDEEMSVLTRADAQEKSEELAAVLIQYELGGAWDVERIHLASHTLASLAASAQDEVLHEWARAVETFSADWLGGRSAVPADGSEFLAEALAGLSAAAQSFARGLTAAPAPLATLRVLADWSAGNAAETTLQGEREDEDDWTLRLSEADVEVETLEPSLEVPAGDADRAPLETPGPSDAAGEGFAEAALQDESLKPDWKPSEVLPETSLGNDVEAQAMVAEPAPLATAVLPVEDMPGTMAETTSQRPLLAPTEKPLEQTEMPHDRSPTMPDAKPMAETEGDEPSEEASPDQLGIETTRAETSEEEANLPPNERDLAWDDVFNALSEIQTGFSRLSSALLKLHEQDSGG